MIRLPAVIHQIASRRGFFPLPVLLLAAALSACGSATSPNSPEAISESVSISHPAAPVYLLTPPSPAERQFEHPAAISFVSKRDGNYDIYLMNADGTNPVNLTNSQDDDLFPTWSPDGSRMAYTSYILVENMTLPVILVAKADGSEPQRLLAENSVQVSPAWSPRGDLIAYEANGRILIVTAEGGFTYPLNANPNSQHRPSWAPDGQRIVYEEIFAARLSLLIGDTESGLSTPIFSREEIYLGYPAWSPDGSRIAFTMIMNGNTDIYTIFINGTGLTRLTNDPGYDAMPAWSPDGSQIAFVSGRAGSLDIFLMNADGTGETNLTSGSFFEDTLPSWRP